MQSNFEPMLVRLRSLLTELEDARASDIFAFGSIFFTGELATNSLHDQTQVKRAAEGSWAVYVGDFTTQLCGGLWLTIYEYWSF